MAHQPLKILDQSFQPLITIFGLAFVSVLILSNFILFFAFVPNNPKDNRTQDTDTADCHSQAKLFLLRYGLLMSCQKYEKNL